ncbi:MAG: Gfo/Idh/MocA family oxidoreductase [Lentisphaerae bacterium]|jgi:predicted homoserine dehydrogenase-like protein|nr:Gfo/Idh/MocA family oxidoreductase [Lentisphaerota bacterium]MBT4821421.1 Gfo/Idh/MocA family oxidoreductase [Lentisphaerota bacterium]MBT5612610.1 Gfo/Idh/MocA family oxidoreductase [Lentisphaerota bacterium]MBT7059269.1 Gfo/Idh/MocA family oxidoreductase [Lentisphaerota bacterium]MBT7845800.1 Gfo/Idh/MocA family oxidoreductase [Lentisphaerota bacterium]
MVIVDTALKRCQEEGTPVRVGLVGAGYMGRAIALQIEQCVPGMRVAGISNRHIERAQAAYRLAETPHEPVVAAELQAVEHAVAQDRPVVTEDPQLLCQAAGIDAVVDCTGDIEFGAGVALAALSHGKHLVLLNAELDATLGPILKHRADQQGVVCTGPDGDEPGVAMTLYRLVASLGLKPVLAGNLKGLYDPYRNPDTQRAFAEKVGQDPRAITSYADGTKLSMETCVLANAAGFTVGKRGMFGHACDHVDDVVDLFEPEPLMDRGWVDFLVGAKPGTGAFVVGYSEHPVSQQYLSYFKLGGGPLYCFYTPFHLPHLQLPLTVARAALFGDPTVTPVGAPCCDVLTVAKRDLKAGAVLDGIGGFDSYALLDDYTVCRQERLLPMGVSAGCQLIRDVSRDAPITYSDVTLPKGRLCDQLRTEMEQTFPI